MRRHYGSHHGASMKRRVGQIVLLATLMIVPAVTCAQGSATSARDSDSARVLSLETLWNLAEVDKDASALGHLLADSFTFVDIDGSLKNKAEFLDSVKHPPEHIETIGNDTLKTHVYQDTVIVIGTYHERGTLNGKGYVHRGRFTDTWVRQGSSWMCVASQSTLIQH
jgi:ketosteroid isomerase-like protein